MFGSTRYGESQKDFFGKECLKKDPSENESCIFKFAGFHLYNPVANKANQKPL